MIYRVGGGGVCMIYIGCVEFSSGYPGVVSKVDPMRGHSPSYWFLIIIASSALLFQ